MSILAIGEFLPQVGESWTNNNDTVKITEVNTDDPQNPQIYYHRLDQNGNAIVDANYSRNWQSFQQMGFIKLDERNFTESALKELPALINDPVRITKIKYNEYWINNNSLRLFRIQRIEERGTSHVTRGTSYMIHIREVGGRDNWEFTNEAFLENFTWKPRPSIGEIWYNTMQDGRRYYFKVINFIQNRDDGGGGSIQYRQVDMVGNTYVYAVGSIAMCNMNHWMGHYEYRKFSLQGVSNGKNIYQTRGVIQPTYFVKLLDRTKNNVTGRTARVEFNSYRELKPDINDEPNFHAPKIPTDNFLKYFEPVNIPDNTRFVDSSRREVRLVRRLRFQGIYFVDVVTEAGLLTAEHVDRDILLENFLNTYTIAPNTGGNTGGILTNMLNWASTTTTTATRRPSTTSTREAEERRAEERRRRRESRMLEREIEDERRRREATEKADRDARKLREEGEKMLKDYHQLRFGSSHKKQLESRKKSMRVQDTCPICTSNLGHKIGNQLETRGGCSETLFPDRNPNNYFQMCECNHIMHRKCFYQYLLGGYVTGYPMQFDGEGACNWILENLQNRISFNTRAEDLNSDDGGKILRYTAPNPDAFGYRDKWLYDTFSYQQKHSKSKLALIQNFTEETGGTVYRHLEVQCPICKEWNFLASNNINNGRFQSGKLQFKSLGRPWNRNGSGLKMFDKLQLKF
jgi:hypothetical protein